jgi:hypothetical protein
MDQTQLHSSSRLVEAEWVARRLRPFGSGVASIVPDGFPTYLRILHPAYGVTSRELYTAWPYRESLRWADVAAKTGRTMHRLAQFHAISRPKADVSMDILSAPHAGNLPSDLLAILCEVLAQHTNTPESCYFCLWEGHGWLNTMGTRMVWTKTDASSQESIPARAADPLSPVLRAAEENAPRVHFPGRDYLLFEGPLEAAAEFGWKLGDELFIGESPNLFWPQDHAWCIASEIDLFCTLVAGSNELAESLMGDARLEVWRVFADDRVDAYSDDKNR